MNTKHLSILLLTQSMKFEQLPHNLSELGVENIGSPVLTSFDIIAELMDKPKVRWVDWQWRDIYMFYMQEATKVRDNNNTPASMRLLSVAMQNSPTSNAASKKDGKHS